MTRYIAITPAVSTFLQRVAGADGIPCKGEDPEVFFPAHDRNPLRTASRARKFCELCPLRGDCFAYALTYAVEGVWGGTTAYERHKLRVEYGLLPRPIVPPITLTPVSSGRSAR